MKYIQTLQLIVFTLMILRVGYAQTDSLQGDSEKTISIKSYLVDHRKWAIEVPIWVPGFVGEFSYGDVTIEGEDGSDPGIPEHPI